MRGHRSVYEVKAAARMGVGGEKRARATLGLGNPFVRDVIVWYAGRGLLRETARAGSAMGQSGSLRLMMALYMVHTGCMNMGNEKLLSNYYTETLCVVRSRAEWECRLWCVVWCVGCRGNYMGCCGVWGGIFVGRDGGSGLQQFIVVCAVETGLYISYPYLWLITGVHDVGGLWSDMVWSIDDCMIKEWEECWTGDGDLWWVCEVFSQNMDMYGWYGECRILFDLLRCYMGVSIELQYGDIDFINGEGMRGEVLSVGHTEFTGDLLERVGYGEVWSGLYSRWREVL
ncbi:hypothetical protein Tco_1292442 [Tanacetum coccineum]